VYSDDRGDVVCVRWVGDCGFVNVSPIAGRDLGDDRSLRFVEDDGDVWAAALRRSSVAFRRASRASSSEVWEWTFCFLVAC
jgi:hypothetical protein